MPFKVNVMGLNIGICRGSDQVSDDKIGFFGFEPNNKYKDKIPSGKSYFEINNATGEMYFYSDDQLVAPLVLNFINDIVLKK